LTVTASARTKTYGQAVTFAGIEFTTSGLENSDSVSSVTLTSAGAAATAGVAGSPYSIVPSAATGTGVANYTISYMNGSLTVTPAVLTVTANRANTFSGAPLPAFTATITGFLNGDTQAVVTGTPVLTSTATAASPVGTYPIDAAAGTLFAANYTFTFVNGTLTVMPPPPAGISVVSGSGQAGLQGTAFAAPLVALVTDASGSPVVGSIVVFSLTSGAATLSTPAVLTGGDGKAQITATPSAAGAITISASVAGLGAKAVFSETGLPASAAPQLSVLPSALTFAAVQGGGNPAPVSIAISNTGTGSLKWTSSTAGNPPWLTIGAVSGATPAATALSIDTSGLVAGSYRGMVTVTSGALHQAVAVALTVEAPKSNQFMLTPAAVIVNAAAGSTTPIARVIGVANRGSGALEWTASAGDGSSWLSVSQASGAAPGTLTAQLDPSGLAPGQYLGNIAFNSPGVPPASVPVVLNLSALPDLVSSIPVLQFRGLAGSSFAPQSLPVTTSFGGGVSFSANASVATGMNWLTLSGTGAGTPGSISAAVNTSGLAPGYYVGSISVQSAGTRNTLVVPVVLDLGSTSIPGTVSASPGGALLSGPAGSSQSTLTQTIALSSDAPAFSWTAAALPDADGTWLTVSPASGSGSGPFTVSANLAGLGAGIYTGQVAISATGTSNTVLIVPVTLAVTSATPFTSGILQPVEPAGNFVASVGVPVALQAVILGSNGAPVPGAAVQVTFSTGDAPAILTDAGSGTYTGAWTPVQSGPVSLVFSSASLPVGVVTGVVAAGGAQPSFTAAGVVSAATMLSGIPLGVGSISTVFGQNLSARTATATAFPLPVLLGGASVTINGVAAPLFYTSPGQINFFVPYELAGQTTATIAVSTAAGVAEATGVPIAPVAPGLFLVDAGSDAAAVHLDGRLVSAAAPATGGEVLEIFATGLGPISNAPADGAPASLTTLAFDRLATHAIVGGVDAKTIFAGLAPGFTGLYQLDVVVPEGLPSGPATLVVAAGQFMSNTAFLSFQ